MFTNWLTANSSSNVHSSNIYPTLPSSSSSTYDIILEVGPPPFTRFTAHSSVLTIHSGYFRAILHREDNLRSNSSHNNSNTTMDMPIYLPNISADQLEPLLNYMYTGYLGLSIDNIFAVLLATHILHMPRALEICRTFLLKTQSENFTTNNIIQNHLIPPSVSNTSTHISDDFRSGLNKIIRPIPSKAIMDSNISFISPPSFVNHQVLLPSRDTKFKKISKHIENNEHVTNEQTQIIPNTSLLSSPLSPLLQSTQSSSAISNNIGKIKQKKDFKAKLFSKLETKDNEEKLQNKIENYDKEDKRKFDDNPSISTSSSCQNNEIITLKSDSNENLSKAIVDVASCDGPVRFRRVLNNSYGRTLIQSNLNEERHQRNFENQNFNSFHQQMAKSINERNNKIIKNNDNNNNLSDDSENSEDTNHQNFSSKDSNEFYVCVYCKHTFKSQYCYQKHAKRHINPLIIENDNTSDTNEEKNESNEFITKNLSKNKSEIFTNSTQTHETRNSPNNILYNNNKREVKLLDMNVQYYPCKTCGCKFPSYYFVHKHRKMCHADEEN